MAARKEALERTTTTLNQEGHFRQKAEALKTVIDRIVCGFDGTALASIEVVPADGASLLYRCASEGQGVRADRTPLTAS